MKFGTLAAMSALAFALAACGGNTSNTTSTTTTNETVVLPDAMNTMMNEIAPPVSSSQEFVNKAAASDAYEIAAATLAAEKATSAKIKAFAAQMIKTHEESAARLRTAVAGLTPAIVPDATLSAEQEATLADLRAKTGAEFDTAYAAAQVEAHEDALEDLKDYAADGTAPQLKAFASEQAPKVAAALNMALGLK